MYFRNRINTKGQHYSDICVLRAICEILEMSLNDFFELDEEMLKEKIYAYNDCHPVVHAKMNILLPVLGVYILLYSIYIMLQNKEILISVIMCGILGLVTFRGMSIAVKLLPREEAFGLERILAILCFFFVEVSLFALMIWNTVFFAENTLTKYIEALEANDKAFSVLSVLVFLTILMNQIEKNEV